MYVKPYTYSHNQTHSQTTGQTFNEKFKNVNCRYFYWCMRAHHWRPTRERTLRNACAKWASLWMIYVCTVCCACVCVSASASMKPSNTPAMSRRFNYSEYCKPSVIVMHTRHQQQHGRPSGPNYDTRSDLFAAVYAGWFMYTLGGPTGTGGWRNRKLTRHG